MDNDKKIDLSRRKPRQTRGTKAYAAANRFGLGCIVFGVALGSLFL